MATLTLPDGRIIELPPFRDRVPVHAAPDRAAWQAKHGVAPWPVTDARPVYAIRARRAYEKDYSSTRFEDAIDAQTEIDEQTMSVHAQSTAANGDLCFFDPSDGQFWIYPDKP
jgi:hypothetical protein